MNHNNGEEDIMPVQRRGRTPSFDDIQREQVANVCHRLHANCRDLLQDDDDGYRGIQLRFLYPRIKTCEVENALLPALSANRHVESLNLYECFQLDDNDTRFHESSFTLVLRMLPFMPFFPKLKMLNLGGNGLTDEQAMILGRDVLSHPACAIQKLLLAGNKMTPIGAEAIANGLRHNNTTLEELRLSGNKLLGPKGCQTIAMALQYHKSLKVLCLANCNAGDEGAKAIATTLQTNKSLQQLFLGFNKIDDEGCYALADALRFNDALVALCLGSNNITDDGAHAFEQVLTQCNYTLEGVRVYTNVQERINRLCTQNRYVKKMIQQTKEMGYTMTDARACSTNTCSWSHVIQIVNNKPDSLYALIHATHPDLFAS